jgi:hypothetical protein
MKDSKIFVMKMDLSKLNRSNKKQCEKDFKECEYLVKIIKSFEKQGKPSHLFNTYSDAYTDECNRLNKFSPSRFFMINSFAFTDLYGNQKSIVGKIRKFANRFK